jgi:hypothetical protein
MGTGTPEPRGRDPVASYLLALPDEEVTELLAGCLARLFAREAPGTQYHARMPPARSGLVHMVLSGTQPPGDVPVTASDSKHTSHDQAHNGGNR